MKDRNSRSIDLVNHPALTEEDAELLRERTDSLAFETKSAYQADDDLSERYLTISYLDERYGIPLSAVSEAIALTNIVALPGAPPHVVGLTRLRGQILALVNLHIFWRNRVSGHSDCDRAVIVSVGEISFGLVCSKVEGLRNVPDSDIEQTPSDLPSLTQKTIRGITDRNILLLAPDRLVAAPGFVMAGSDGEME